jgi:hypothetical protein
MWSRRAAMLRTIVLGGLGGLAGTVAVWWLVSRSLDKQLQAGGQELSTELLTGRGELESRLAEGRRELTDRIRQEVATQVPPTVRRELESTLARYNITPATGRQISSVLTAAERMGFL